MKFSRLKNEKRRLASISENFVGAKFLNLHCGVLDTLGNHRILTEEKILTFHTAAIFTVIKREKNNFAVCEKLSRKERGYKRELFYLAKCKQDLDSVFNVLTTAGFLCCLLNYYYFF